MSNLGYNKPLYILPFDHRSSFLKKMFGIKDRQSSKAEAKAVSDLKQVIYEGFKLAVDGGQVPKTEAAILVDEQFCGLIIRDAVKSGYTVCLATEKSGQDEYDFEYGVDFGQHLDEYKPAFAKALVRYNPADDAELNVRQRARLKQLTDFCHSHGYKFIIEPLIPPTEEQLVSVGGDQARYDEELRPVLMVKMVAELQAGGVEPDVWKIEGFNQPKDYQTAIKQIKSDGRNQVGAIVLGRGADTIQVETWLKAGAAVDGIIGFAVGRTTFWDALVSYHDGKITREQAADQIAKNYSHFYQVFNQTK